MMSKRNERRASCTWQGTDEKTVWLRGYQVKAQEIRRLEEEIGRWRALMLPGRMDFARPSRGKPGAAPGEPSRVETVAEKLLELQDDLLERVEALVDLRREVEGAIAALADERYRLLLRMRFIDGYSLNEIADRLSYSQRQICNLSREALNALPFPKKKCP